MEAILLYFVKVILSSGVMFLYYQLSLKDKTFHHYNRFYLLSAILISLLLPLITVDDFTIEVNNDVYSLLDKIQNFNTTKNIENDHTYFRIIFSALGLVSLYFLGRFIYGIFRIQQLKSQFQKESFDGINFYHTNLTEAPFSYFKNLFWKNTIILNSDIGKQILKHEMVHIEQKHSFDKIFIEVITSVFWFNPFFHIIKKEISLIHEYLADKKAVKQSDTKAFAQMLLASHFSGTQLPATSPFLSSNLKKRFKMLQKPKTKFGYARRIFALPVLFSVAFAYMVNAKNKEIKETNIAIEEAVSQIKKDTIRPEKSRDIIATPKGYKKSDDEKKIADLSKKIQEKSKALKELKPESKEFQKHVDELGELSSEIGKIASSDNFQKTILAYRMDGSEMKNINDFFKSDEWKNKVKELKSMNIEMPEMPEMNFDFPDVPPFPKAPNVPDAPNAPNSPNVSKARLYKFNERQDMKWSPEADMVFAERAKESASTAKKRAELDRKRAKLDEKRAKLEGERAKLDVERRVLEGKNGRVYIQSNSFSNIPKDKMLRINAQTMRMNKGQNDSFTITTTGSGSVVGDTGDMKIFIDGKPSTKQDMEALKPNEISSMNIMKNSNNGKTEGSIQIQTKK